MPGEQGSLEVDRGLAEEAVGSEVELDTLALFFDRDSSKVAAARGEELGGRQLHFVADDDDLMRSVERRNRFFEWNLACFVEDHDVKGSGVKRECVGDRKGAHEPD